MLLTAERELPPPTVATLLEGGAQLPKVQLIDKMGQNFSTPDLSGKFSLLFFGFTHCPDICPLTLNVLANMHNDWATPTIAVPEVVFISVDHTINIL